MFRKFRRNSVQLRVSFKINVAPTYAIRFVAILISAQNPVISTILNSLLIQICLHYSVFPLVYNTFFKLDTHTFAQNLQVFMNPKYNHQNHKDLTI